ncbi:MAG: YqaA family protein [Planctomycetota bacterium]|nr:YqaA family protein [Planctomycetota bacterium]
MSDATTPTSGPPDASTLPAATSPATPRWAIHKRLYEWVLSLAHSAHGSRALFLLAFAESSFFPIPPDVLQIALTLERRTRAFFYAAVSTVGSVLGGLAGYAIGWGLWSVVSPFFFRYVFDQAVFTRVESLYQEHDFWCVFIAAFTPIPYKVFTIAGGVFGINLLMFFLASLVGRAGRFFLVATLLWWFGPPIKGFIDRYFNLLSVVFTVLLIGAFVLLKYV